MVIRPDPPADKDIIAMYAEGMAMKDIAARGTRSHAWVRQRLVELGVQIRPQGGGSKTPERAGQAVHLYTVKKMAMKDIASELGMSQSWVNLALNDAGVPLRRPGKELDADSIIAMYVDDRQPLTAIAAALGVDPGRVKRILNEHDVEIRSVGEALRKIDCEALHRLYIEERLDTPEVAKRLGVSASGVSSAMQRCGITARRDVALEVTRDELKAHLAEGLSDEQIAVLYGVTTGAVTMHKRALKVRRPHAKPAHTRPSPPVDELAKLYVVDRQSMAAIATRYEVPHPSVRRWLKDAGIELRTGPYTRNTGHDEITKKLLGDLYTNQEMTAAEVGEQVGVTKKTILTHLRRHGIAVRPPGARRPGTGMTILERLYADLEVQQVVATHGIGHRHPTNDAAAAPLPPLNKAMLEDLYNEIGLSLTHIALLTQRDEQYIRKGLQEHGIQARSPRTRSPWTRANPA